MAEFQSQKFIDKAKELSCDEDEAGFDSTLTRITKPAAAHRSDCVVHNVPAMEPGECTCGAIAGQ